MLLEHQIDKSIYTYPSLYKAHDRRTSRLLVLDHLFNTIGNGYEWANTKDPAKGGYLTEPNSRKLHGDWVRNYDLPYGKEKFQPLPEQFFSEQILRVREREQMHGLDEGPLGDMFRHHDFDKDKTPLQLAEIGVTFVSVRVRKGEGSRTTTLLHVTGYDDSNKAQFLALHKLGLTEDNASTFGGGQRVMTPYPVSHYSAIWEIYHGKDMLVQDDWLRGAVDLAEESLAHYNTEARYKEDTYYPKERDARNDRNQMAERKRKGDKELAELKKIWGYDKTNEVPTVKLILEKKTKFWEKHRADCIKFYEKFLKKYKA